MAGANHLVQLALAAVRGAHHGEAVAVGHAGEIGPEVPADASVARVANGADDFAVLDLLSVLAVELELVAAVIDRPRVVGVHVHAVFDRGDELVDRCITGLDVEVGHAVNRWSVPTGGSRVRHALESTALLTHRATETALQNAVLDQELLGRRGAVVVKAVAGELTRHGRVEGDVEEVRAVAEAAEHVRRDEAGAGVVALVAEDPVEFQRVADRLVNLQDHLIRSEEDVHDSRGAVGSRQKLEGLVGHPRSAVAETEPVEHLSTTLATEGVGAKGAGLGVDALICCGPHAGIHELKPLLDFAPLAVATRSDQQRVDASTRESCRPVDDPVVDTEQARLLMQEFEPVFKRH